MIRPFEGEWPQQSHELRADAGHVVRKRGAVVKAMAICTPHPFIQIFKVRFLSYVLCAMRTNQPDDS